MPFPKQGGRAFTRANIELLQPNQYGVYGLFRPDAWVYVGMGDIRGRLLNHLNGDNPSITRERPAGYVTWVTSNAADAERQVIHELKPIANSKAGYRAEPVPS